MSIIKLQPAYKDYIWGGNKLKEKYNKEYNGERLAETWELSCHEDGLSIIKNGKHSGMSLKEYISLKGQQVLGNRCDKFTSFPILIKLIDAKENLSVQVHPDDAYALKNEGQYGKTEMWYVLDCEKDAFLYYGLNKDLSEKEFRKRISDNTLLEVLNKVTVHKGDVFYIPPGTIHAIGKGIIIAEVQQSSNLTYRVYDYGRIGIDGKLRELHIDKATEVTNLKKTKTKYNFKNHIVQCEYFTADIIKAPYKGYCDNNSFVSLLITNGNGEIICDNECEYCCKGDSIFLPAESGEYKLTGDIEAIITMAGE